jgi:hypothetical protein
MPLKKNIKPRLSISIISNSNSSIYQLNKSLTTNVHVWYENKCRNDTYRFNWLQIKCI